MNHLNPGLISAYNSLTDKHLAGYFSNTRIRRHLHRAGLITRSGRIVPDKEYRQKLIQRAHQRHVRECLAQAIFHKVLEMERLHQIEIKRKLEEFARRERVHKIKVERSKRYEEDIIRILSPHPPTGARGIRKQHSGPEGEHTESSESPGSSRPNTAPGKMQRPVRLKPLHSNSTTASHRHSSPYRRQHPPHHNQRPFNGTMDKDPDRRLNAMEVRNGISPYCLPVINNFVTPVPPSTRRKERPVKLSTSGTVRGRRLRPTTGSSAADVSEDPPSMLRSSVPQSRVRVNMVYLGKSVHLSNDLPDLRDEVKVFQQHCGGENLCIYKGKLREGESFQFISRRHRGFPFSLTFFLNGLQVERLSSCCEFKHRKSSRLGGRHGHFAFTGVEAASPCYKCIIALGLDKKPVPPPKRMKEDAVKMGIVPRLTVTAGADTETTKAEDPVSRSECESSPRKDTEKERAHEDSKVKDDYEEDFEADDEGPVEEEKNCTSPNGEREEKVKETAASESEESEKEGGVKSRSGSSFTGSDREESDAEEVKEAKAEDKEEPSEEAQEEVQEEAPCGDAAAAQPAEAKDSETQDSAGQSTEIEIGDNSGPSGNENRETSDTHTTSEGERRTDESTQDEPERAKSVQEKLAEAVLKESHCSSEPELSDTSTETEASSNKSAEKETKVAEAVAETTTGQLEVIEEEKKMEEPVTREVKAVVHKSEEQEEIIVDNTELNDRVSDKAASEVAKEAGENETSEEIVEDAKTSALQDEPKDEVREDGEATEQDAKSVQKEDESAASDLSHKPNESAEADNTEPLTVTETMEMKAEAPDTQEAVGAEEGPATDTQGNDTKQEVEEQTREGGEVKTKEELICEDAKEESVAESEEKQKMEGKNEGQEATEEQSDLNEGEKDEPLKEGNTEDLGENKPESDVIEEVAEEAGANLNPDEQNKDGLDKSEKEAEDMGENKPEGELMSEENAKVVKLLDTGLNTAQTGDDADESSSQKDVSEKAKEELERTEQDGSQKGDANKEKSDDDDERNTVKDQGETQHSEGEAECAGKEVVELENPGSTSLKEEGQETSADKCEDSAQMTEENVKSEDVVASVAEETPKDTENNAQGAEESEKGNKDVSEEADVKEVDAENGEVSVVPDAKQTVEKVQKEESENTIDDAHNMGEHGKLGPSNEPEKAELKQDNRNNGHDINNVASEEIVKPPSKDSDTAENNNNEEIAQSDADTTGQVEAADAFAAEGENGDTEEASKASEEGASVLLKPQVKSSLSEHIDETEPKGSPEGLTTADSADLVTNWVTMHQTSKYFETFVEPLEEIREVNSEASNEQPSELHRSESPVKMVRGGGKDDVTDTKDETSDVGSNPSEAKPDGSTKDTGQARESQVLHVPNAENEETVKEPVIEESLRSKEDQTVESSEGDKIHDSLVQLNNNVARTSITSSHLSITSGKQTVSEMLNEEKASDQGQDTTKIQDTKIEELPETLEGLNGPEHTISDAPDNSESKEVTVTAELTVSKTDSASQQESHKTQESGNSEEKKELIEDSSHTVSKEHLSSFSVDNTVFGRSAHTLLTTSTAENGH